jgi:putative hemin transport protein
MNEQIISSTQTDTASLLARYTALRAEQPNLRIRSAADTLGVSEMALLALDCGDNVTRLEGDAQALVPEIESLGEVMALTRNNAFVHEKIGTYRNISFDGGTGLVLDEAIDLRIFGHVWKHAFAVTTNEARSTRHSIQFFDAVSRTTTPTTRLSSVGGRATSPGR